MSCFASDISFDHVFYLIFILREEYIESLDAAIGATERHDIHNYQHRSNIQEVGHIKTVPYALKNSYRLYKTHIYHVAVGGFVHNRITHLLFPRINMHWSCSLQLVSEKGWLSVANTSKWDNRLGQLWSPAAVESWFWPHLPSRIKVLSVDDGTVEFRLTGLSFLDYHGSLVYMF